MPQKPSAQRAMSSVSAGCCERQRPSTAAADCATAELAGSARRAARMAAMRMALATTGARATWYAATWPRGRGALLAIGAIALALLSLVIGVAALGSAFGLADLPHPLAMLDARLPIVFRIHMLAGAMGLVLLPVALALRGVPWLHRRLGRAAATLLLVAA